MFEIENFNATISSFNEKLAGVSEETASIKLSEDKWSLKEIIGHLIDSASNNHQRFVRLQFDDLMSFPVYETEEWVRLQGYAHMDWKNLITLWYSYNQLLLDIIKNIDTSTLGNVWIKGEDALTLSHLVNDYYNHMELHINQFDSRLEEVI